MLSYYHYWQALRRLKSSQKTVEMMQPDVPNMVLAQHEMIEREVEYYRSECETFTIILLTLFLFAGIIVIYFKDSFYV